MFLAVTVSLLVALGAYAAYATYVTSAPPGETTLVVYTYPSLLGGADCAAPAFASVFDAFASVHRVHFDIECPSGTLSSALIGQAGAPRADLVIGLDEITAAQADAAGVLLPYDSPQLGDVPAGLVATLSPDHAATPYESGYLSIDYSAPFFDSTHGGVAHSSFTDFAANSTWARALTIEDPTVDITGEEFLLWEIAYYQQVLHQDWTSFWVAADPSLHTAPDWGTAFTDFNASTGTVAAVASYATDPAYAAYYGVPGTFNATVSEHNGIRYGWQSVYGIGIVRGSAHVGLDQQFIDWFLSGTVQSQIPTTEWEYPANDSTALPPAFSAALDPAGIVPLNGAIPASSMVNDLGTWLSEWQTLENTYG
jgi:thiamine transport system substrate-binding protein